MTAVWPQLDPCAVGEVFGATPAPETLERLQHEVAAAIASLRFANRAGERVSTQPRVAGAVLADWLPAQGLADLLSELTSPRRLAGLA